MTWGMALLILVLGVVFVFGSVAALFLFFSLREKLRYGRKRNKAW